MLRVSKRQLIRSGVTSSLLPALSLTFSLVASASETEWSLEKEGERIQCYTSPVMGSPFLAVKVTALVNAPIEKVTKSLGTGDACSEWQAMCKSSTVLSTVSDTERYVYTVLDLPWPLSDRDMVVRSIVHIDPEAKTVTVKLESASARHPEQNYVRAESNGQYRIRLINDQQVEFTYVMHTDLGGDLSPDLINPRVSDSTYEDVRRLQVLAEK